MSGLDTLELLALGAAGLVLVALAVWLSRALPVGWVEQHRARNRDARRPAS